MKQVAFILSLLILLLSLTPCSDGDKEESQHKDEVSATHDHQGEAEDTCPITCICNCCGIAITYQPLATYYLHPNSLIIKEIRSSYKSNYMFDFDTKIWQPPQLIS